MDKITNNAFIFINKVINSTNPRNYDFYSNVINDLSMTFKGCNFAIYLQQDVDFLLKAGSFDVEKYDILASLSHNFLQDENKTIKLLKENLLIAKLTINTSFFGLFVVLSDNKINDNEIAIFESIANVISYKIKDFELSQVYKMQLKAIQNAISDKQDAYLVIKKQHEKLKELDKTKNLFLANISHDLRTPLNAIIGFSQALDSQIFGELNEKQAEYIRDIQISSLHLLGMINEILDLSKLEAHAVKFNPIELDPSVAIKEITNILEPLYSNKNIKLNLNLQPDFKIKADNQKFQQILYNLLSNAIKFTSNNGKIEINSFLDNKDYLLEINDNGIGIDKKNHSKIFKKYVHLNNTITHNQGSTGLGLAITKEFVKLHNGTIVLESELNKGSSFKMRFKNIVL